MHTDYSEVHRLLVFSKGTNLQVYLCPAAQWKGRASAVVASAEAGTHEGLCSIHSLEDPETVCGLCQSSVQV